MGGGLAVTCSGLPTERGKFTLSPSRAAILNSVCKTQVRALQYLRRFRHLFLEN